MKTKTMIISIALSWFMTLLISCGNDSDNRADNADSVPAVHESPNGPAPDNSDATNPSLKDSVYTDSAR